MYLGFVIFLFSLGSLTCDVPHIQCNTTAKADIILLVDGSLSIGHLNFKTIRTFIARMVGVFDIGPDRVQIGLVQCSGDPKTEWHLNAHRTRQELLDAVANLTYEGGNTMTGLALNYILQNNFQTNVGLRPDARKIGVLITDGKSQDEIDQKSANLRTEGIELYTIGVKQADENELRSIASDPDEIHMYNVVDFSFLLDIVDNLTVNLCNSVKASGFNRCGGRNGGCSHLCLPNPNGTSCACPTGVLLMGDGRTCEDGPKTFLLFSTGVSIHRISMDTADRTDVPVPVPEQLYDVTSLDYDSVEGKIYYISDALYICDIRRANLDGSGMETVVGEHMINTEGLVVDAVGRKIYWINRGTKRIEVANLDGSMRKVLIWQNLDEPRAIALDHEMGYMYWTDSGEHAKLERSGMDGSERVILISNNLVWPTRLAIDKAGSQLLWANTNTNCIEAADLNGANRRTLVSPVQDPYGLTLLGPHIYWTDRESDSIQRADKTTGANIITVQGNLRGLRGIQAVDRERPLGFNRCGGRNGGCSHLCLPNPNGTSCACPTGVLLRGDGHTCEDGPKTFLLFSTGLSIHRISMDTADRTDVPVPVPELHDVTSLDYDSVEGKIYYTDMSNGVIRRANLDGSGMETVVGEDLKNTEGLVVDAVGRKIYWTDWGTKRIEVANLDGSMRKVLIWQNLDEPRAIALDHEMGYMYWTDRGEPAKLERSGMDGSERIVLISNNLVWPTVLAIDKEGSQLLWTDSSTKRIEAADLNGANRRTLVSPVQRSYGLTLLGPHIYWTELQSRSVQRADKTTGANVITVWDNLLSLRGIQAVDRERPLGFNRCGGRNGGCSHLCLPNPNGTSCACPTGVLLMGDGHACEDVPKTFLLFSNRDSIRRISMDTADRTDVPVPVPELHDVTSLDYDSVEDKIYYTDMSNGVIRRANLDGSIMETVVREDLNTTLGLAVDAVGRKIYWTDRGTKRIEVANLDGSMRKVLIWQNLDEPWAIALYPEMGYMYWTDLGEHAKLERSGMDGSERVVLISNNLLWPTGLAIDKAGSQLLLTDSSTKRIEAADLNGANRRTLVSLVQHPYGLTLLGPHIYWTDRESRSIQRADKTTGDNIITVSENVFSDLRGIQAVDRERALSFNRCGGGNGGCSHLCLPNPNGTSCACPTGVLLMGDGRTCEDVPKTFLLFSTGASIRRISMDTADCTDVPVPVPEQLYDVISLDYDSVEGKIYYISAGMSIGIIRRANLDGSGMETVVGEDLKNTEGLVVDAVGRKIYWTDWGTKRIEVANLDGSMRKVLIWQNLEEPWAIALDHEMGYMYWTDWGEHAKLERSGMNGSERVVLISNNLARPYGLAIDKAGSQLIWADTNTKRIEAADLNGANRRTLVSLVDPYGLTLLGPHIYWTDGSSIQRADKTTGANVITVRGNLPYLRGMQAVDRERPLGFNRCGGRNGGCSHLCLPNPNGTSCACPTGVLLRGDGRTCEDGPKNFLLFSYGFSIHRISMDTADRTDVPVPVPKLHNVPSLDYDSVEGKIYYTDMSNGVIRRANLDGSGMETVIGEDLKNTEGLVVDAVGRKIYWTNRDTKRIEVANLDRSMRKVLIWQNLDEPRAIALDHEMGYMYWIDWGWPARLERSGMDGSERVVIINNNLVRPYGLAIDKEGSQLIWTDYYTKRIEAVDLNGANRRTLVSLVQHPFSLTLLRPHIYWTEEESIKRADKTTGANVITVRDNLWYLRGIQAVDREKPLGFNRCGGRNGGCSHLCLPNPNRTLCACPTGVLLRGDGRTCEDGPKTFLLFSTGVSIRRISMDTADHTDVPVPLPKLHNVTTLDYDSVEGKIYYADVSIGVIRRANLNGSGMETVVGQGLTTTDSLAVDWVARNMYWTDTDRNTIEVARLDGSARKVLINDSLDEPRAIAVFPSKGYLFWTDWGNISKIERAHLDGSNRRVLINTDLGWPNGLTLDYDTHRIFWVDAYLDRIESSDLDGKLRQILVSPVSHPFGLTQSKPVSSEQTPLFHLSQQDRWIYWTDRQTKSIQRVNKRTGRSNETVLANVAGLMDIIVVSPQRQNGTNHCGVDNGGCTHLCLAKTIGFTCACPDTPDSRSCSTDVISDIKMPLWYAIARWLGLLALISTTAYFHLKYRVFV